MNQIKFLVLGSSEYPYEVNFIKRGNNLSAYCTCPAERMVNIVSIVLGFLMDVVMEL